MGGRDRGRQSGQQSNRWDERRDLRVEPSEGEGCRFIRVDPSAERVDPFGLVEVGHGGGPIGDIFFLYSIPRRKIIFFSWEHGALRCVSLCITVCRYLTLSISAIMCPCVSLSLSVSQCVAACCHVSLFVAVCSCLSLSIAVYRCVSLSDAACPSAEMFC